MAIVLGRKGGGSGGGGGGSVNEITSTDNSVTITDPSGPTVDLSVSGGSLPDGWVANDPAPTALNAGGGTLLNVGTLSAVSFQASPFAPGDTVFGAGDGKITGLAEGTDPTDAATVSQLGGSQTLADVLLEGNDAGFAQIKNLDAGTDPEDAATVAQLSAKPLDEVLATGNDADDQAITGVHAISGAGAGSFSVSRDAGVDSSPSDTSTVFKAHGDDGATIALDAGGLPVTNLAEGTDPSDAATVGQLNGVEESIPLAIAGSNIRTAAGVPSGAPDPGANELPFAYDTTAVTGGFYYWNGAAWVKIATIL